jgi:hypothetical protein
MAPPYIGLGRIARQLVEESTTKATISSAKSIM